MKPATRDLVLALGLMLWWLLLSWLVSLASFWSMDRGFMMIVAGAVAVDMARNWRERKSE